MVEVKLEAITSLSSFQDFAKIFLLFGNHNEGKVQFVIGTYVMFSTSHQPIVDSRERPHFVPSFLLSNPMSLPPKIDEIAFTIKQWGIDVAHFTETWLKNAIPDGPINITGYQLFRRDRQHQDHGGVCLYVKNSIQCSLLPELFSDVHEVIWVCLRPRRLPRGFSNIIVAVIRIKIPIPAMLSYVNISCAHLRRLKSSILIVP